MNERHIRGHLAIMLGFGALTGFGRDSVLGQVVFLCCAATALWLFRTRKD